MSLKALRRSRRRLLASRALSGAAAIALASASTYAVHLDASGTAPGGALGFVIGMLELIFVAAIIPLVLTSLYCVSSVAAMMVSATRERRALPRASAKPTG